MGQIGSRLSRPFFLFNIEERAFKAISKDRKLVPSQQYKSIKKQMEMAKNTTPDFMEKHNTKDKVLDNYLKNVYVTGHDIPEPTAPVNPERPLPQNRNVPTPYQFGIYEPETARKGRCTMRQMFAFISKHHDDPKGYDAKRIAQEYYLDEKVTANILDYFKLFQVQTKNDYDVVIHSTGSKFEGIKEPDFEKQFKTMKEQGSAMNIKVLNDFKRRIQ